MIIRDKKISIQTSQGFTIVELLVIIAVIGILASIVTFSIGNWRQRTAQTEVTNDLKSASIAMENARIFNNAYPASLPSSFSASANVTVTLKTSTTTSYCIEGASKVVPGVTYSIRSTQADPVNTVC